MPNSRLLSLLVFGVAFALGVASCSQDTQEGESGSLSLQLTIAGDLEIDEVAWVITGGDMPSMNGTIDTSAPGSTASIEVYGLPPSTGQDYRITMEAIATDGVTTCKGSEDFGIDVGEVTEIMVFLNCKRPQRLGSVRVNGKFNICAQLIKATAAPLQTSVGNDIDLTSQAEDADDDPILQLVSDKRLARRPERGVDHVHLHGGRRPLHHNQRHRQRRVLRHGDVEVPGHVRAARCGVSERRRLRRG